MRVYSPEWVAAFNAAVAELPPDPGTADFVLRQVVTGTPEGTTVVTLAANAGHLSLTLGVPADPGAAHAAPDGPASREPDVTVSLSYDDAVALSRGEVDPGRLLAAGRVKVRGDLAVLVKGQALLATAAPLVAGMGGAAGG